MLENLTVARSTAKPALSIRNLSKIFGATHALKDVSFDVMPGVVHGLLGGNGSGKSTLIKILAGVHQAEPGGQIDLRGRVVSADSTSPERARASGLRFVHQNPAVFGPMTVLENMAIGHQFPTRAGVIKWPALRAHTKRLLDRYEIDARADDELGTLRQADQTMIAIVRALQDADENEGGVLVLDEPTASLPDHEVGVLLSAVRKLSANGHTILFVSHRLEEVLQITDHVTILRDGAHIETRKSADMTEAKLIEYIVGRPLERVYAHTQRRMEVVRSEPVVLEVSGLAGGPLRNLSLSLHRGEVLGIAGLLGSGRTELMRMIFGAETMTGGSLTLNGKNVRFNKPQEAMDAGIAYVPEDRQKDGIFQSLSVRENLSIAEVAKYRKGGLLRRKDETDDAARSIVRFRIKAGDQQQPISSLSGGNQQKVVLARWLRRNPKVLLLDEPTQGVDVGAREDLYAVIRKEVEAGMAVLVASSDFEELAQICDRILLLVDGEIVAETSGADIDGRALTELVLSRGKVHAEGGIYDEHK